MLTKPGKPGELYKTALESIPELFFVCFQECSAHIKKYALYYTLFPSAVTPFINADTVFVDLVFLYENIIEKHRRNDGPSRM